MFIKSLSIFLTLIMGWSSSAFTSHQRGYFGDDADEKAKPSILLKRTIYSPPSACKSQDFKSSCGTDQRCKERKEVCGDEVSREFTDSLISTESGFSHIRIHDGKYRGNNGIDDFRSGVKAGSSYTVSTENKAGSSRLNSQTNQHSMSWNGQIISKLATKGKLSSEQEAQIRTDMHEGRFVRGYSHIDMENDEFLHSYGVVLPLNDNARPQAMIGYCSSVHPQIMVEAGKPGARPTKQLEEFDSECQKMPFQTVFAKPSGIIQIPSSSYEPYASTRHPKTKLQKPSSSSANSSSLKKKGNVCCHMPYSQEKLRDFIEYLVDVKGFSKTSIAAKTEVTRAVIKSVIDNPYYKPRQYSLSDLWASLQKEYQYEFNKWVSRR